MEFQEAPDWISLAIAKLSAAFPRFKVPQGTLLLLRERFQKHRPEVVDRAVSTLSDSCEGSFPSLAEIARALRDEAEHTSGSGDSSVDAAAGAFESMSAKERKAHGHALWVLHAADCERRGVRYAYGNCEHAKRGDPCACEDRIEFLNAEMLAHGVRISSDGSRVQYDPTLLLRPKGCLREERLTAAMHGTTVAP